MAVRIVTDSTNYLPAEDLRALGVRSVPLWVLDGDEMRDENSIDLPAFYRRLSDTSVLPTSSQPSPEALAVAFRDAFDDVGGVQSEASAEAGNAVLGIFLSSRMSGTVQAAELAATMLREERPGASITVLDSESNCMQEGYAVLSAAEKAAQGADVEECLSAARETMARTRFLFSPTSLEYLRRGGRISGAASFLGGLLQVAPILTVENGETTAVMRVRTHAKAMAEMGIRMKADIERCGLRRAVVHSIAEQSIAEGFARDIVEPIVGKPVSVVPIGPVIGLHVGPAAGVVYETVEPLR